MNNYKLKRDLPFAKAGADIDEIASYRGLDKPSLIVIGRYKCDIPEGENIFDWVEKIGPREWYIGVCDKYESLHDDYESAKGWGQTIKSQNQEIIKVREVINE